MNKDIKANTVKASNQNKVLTKEYGCEWEKANFKVLCVGNSITRHSIKEEIGWLKECGMAASCLEKDYVHQLMYMLEKDKNNVAIAVYGIGSWEMDYKDDSLLIPLKQYIEKLQPDVVIFRLGENFNKGYVNSNVSVDEAFEKIYQTAATNNIKQIIFTSLFWAWENIDKPILNITNKHNCQYVKISDLGEQDKYKAINEYPHYGVSIHPNDLGMLNIAERLYKVIKL